MTRSPLADDACYDAVARFVDDCLRREGSLFTPERSIWSEACAGDLHKRVTQNRDAAKGVDFLQRLRGPLAGGSEDVVQLAAEVLYVLLLAQDTRPATKREHVVAVLNLSAPAAALPDVLSEALTHGIASYGPALSQRFAQYVFLVEFVHAWTQRPLRERNAILLDAERFRTLIFSLPRKSASSQVEALLHMVFPEDFEPIISAESKRKIVKAFGEDSSDESLSIDRRIAQIRRQLTREYGDRFSFEDPEVRARWERERTRTPADRKAWLVRAASNQGTNMLSQWFDEEFVSVGWKNLTRFDTAASQEQIRLELSRSAPESPPGPIRRAAGIFKRFLAIDPGDLILTPDADKLYVARASAQAYWNEGEDASCLRRPVEWLNRDSPASRAGLKRSAPSLYARLQTLSTVCDLKDAEAVKRLVDNRDEQSSGEDPAMFEAVPDPPPGASEPEMLNDPTPAPVARKMVCDCVLPAATDQLADSLYLPRAWLQHAIDLLGEKRQLILYGPPGTGKTFVAQALGEHVRCAGGDWQLVQFHPAYSYEDFFEGYRPSKRDQGGALQFDLRGGPLRLLAEQAMANPQRPYLLIIDEINRGNIAKIFGELYFLLEYRDRPIRLQYSPEQPFELPKNLFLIGTMNTADRSIALVDSALRRRFYFFALLPHQSPVREVLNRWLAEKGYDTEAARLLEALNDALRRALPDEQFAVGPSYFMPKEGPPNIERIWHHAIQPLLEERFYGLRRPEELEREFGLDAIRALLGGGDASPDPDVEADGDLLSLVFSK
jgi:5-methylcytosine-specific restriction protein B